MTLELKIKIKGRRKKIILSLKLMRIKPRIDDKDKEDGDLIS